MTAHGLALLLVAGGLVGIVLGMGLRRPWLSLAGSVTQLAGALIGWAAP